jgi:hypothetical protein
MITPEDLNRPLDEWKVTHLFRPLSNLADISEKTYSPSNPPPDYREARFFAEQLWTCCDDDDMRRLVRDCGDGAARFVYFVGLHVTAEVLEDLGRSVELHISSDKPFSALASYALELFDKLAKENPRKMGLPQ